MTIKIKKNLLGEVYDSSRSEIANDITTLLLTLHIPLENKI
jgi:hypothetical protein